MFDVQVATLCMSRGHKSKSHILSVYSLKSFISSAEEVVFLLEFVCMLHCVWLGLLRKITNDFCAVALCDSEPTIRVLFLLRSG